MAEPISPDAHAAFQYEGPAQQAGTQISGMWLFLATEMLFFGGLIFTWLFLRRWHAAGFHAAAAQTDLLIGSVNTAILLTSSTAYSWGHRWAERGSNRRLIRGCVVTALLGLLFVALKGVEWWEDFGKSLWPGAADFGIGGPDAGGARLFFTFYFVGTALHAVHMLIGVGLVGWIAWRARRGDFSPGRVMPVEIVGLYWSFVDIVWVTLYPLIYLVDRT